MSPICFGVIVSFNGEDRIHETTRALAPQVDQVIIIDNGSTEACLAKVGALASELPNVQIIDLGCNYGVARALNVGARAACNAGAKWVVTMDQDTTVAEGMVAELRRCAERRDGDLVAATEERLRVVDGEPDNCVPARIAITSGNLVRLEAWEAVGGYNEALFIDSVDFDFCLRLQLAGRRILRCESAKMRHRLGTRRPLGPGILSRITFIEHSPQRRYYMLRNHLYLLREFGRAFPLFLFWKSIHMCALVLRILILGHARRANGRAFLLAIRDFSGNRLGPCEVDLRV